MEFIPRCTKKVVLQDVFSVMKCRNSWFLPAEDDHTACQILALLKSRFLDQ